jgi:hypothetical protein
MPATNYKVWAWGTPVNIGVTGAFYVGIAGVAKKATAAEPYIVANEVFCNALARSMLLPCPPGSTLDKAGEPHFFSLDFNLAGHALPPASGAAIVTAFPRLAWGIILFDTLVMNADRHGRNIAHDTATQRVQIFDHSHAFVRPQGDVSATLAANDGKLCIGGHCLAKEINTLDGFDLWVERIKLIPDYFIDDLVDACATVGLPDAKRKECADFMKKRRSSLENILGANMSSFPKLPTVNP